jgi:enoyl-CoA hydratase/carnithine racemase
MTPFVQLVFDGPLARLTLKRGDKHNALDQAMIHALADAARTIDETTEARVTILSGEGKAFCAGGDFAQIAGGEQKGTLLHRGDYADLLLMMVDCDKPIVAKVNGAAMGGGLGLVAASTFAIASTEATLGTPEINVGLFPMMIMALLARVVPRKRLLEMMLLGEKVDAIEAERLGILTHAVEPGELDETVREIEGQLVHKSPMIMKLGLRAFASQEDLDFDRSLPMLRERFSQVLETEDAREGLLAFLEKREPIWKGR